MLPRELYQEYEIQEQITREASVGDDKLLGYKILEVKWGKNGIETIIEGASFPSRGYAPPEAVFANNILKRLIIKGLPLINPLSAHDKVIEAFSDIGWKIMSPYILKTEYLTPFSRELEGLARVFLKEIGIEDDRTARIIAHLFEYDNAYRLRLEDLFNETNPEIIIANPRKEIARLLELNRQREIQHKESVSNKFKLVANALGLIFLLPKYKNALKKALEQCNYKNLCVDNTELYWMCHRTDYNFLGKTYKERVEMLQNAGYNLIKGQIYETK